MDVWIWKTSALQAEDHPEYMNSSKNNKDGKNRKNRIIVIGAGAAGLMAAAAAADAGADVLVLEKNEKAGKKIYITGKGRCNFTNACETSEFFGNVVSNPKFLYSAVYGFDQQQMIDFLEENGCRTKIERGKRAFPLSDHASDVTKALTDHLKRKSVRVRYNQTVKEILTEDNDQNNDENTLRAAGVLLDSGEKLSADAVIVCTGGISYSSTGSTGDGYRFAEDLGLKVAPAAPSLVPFTIKEQWPLELQGLALKNVSVKLMPVEAELPADESAAAGAAAQAEQNGVQSNIAAQADRDGVQSGSAAQGNVPAKKKSKKKKSKPVYEGFGEMLFTHFGISGPLILSASAYADFLKYPAGFVLHLDLKPALSEQELVVRLEKEFSLAPFKEMAGALRPLFPGKLTDVVVQLLEEKCGIRPDRTARTINEKEMAAMASLIKDITMTVNGTRGFAEAVVTRGGVSVKEIDPSTMEAKAVPGLYFAGEVIDVDALTGGFNLQIAWSTGHLAGQSAAESNGD